jgi:Zonular occludens toxin (Zot).
MVQGICGLPGSGKTYYLAKIGREAIKKGREVYANFSLKGAKPYTDLRQLADVREGLILVDEINLLCPSRWWDRFPPNLAYFWSQTRKNQLDLWWSSQHIDRVDKIVREISNWVWEVRKVGFIFLMVCYLPEQLGKAKRTNFGIKVFPLTKKVYQDYNTYERIEVPAWVNKSFPLDKPRRYRNY